MLSLEAQPAPVSSRVLVPCWLSSGSQWSGIPEALRVFVKMRSPELLPDFLDQNLWETGPKNGCFYHVLQANCFDDSILVDPHENVRHVQPVSKGKSLLSAGVFLTPMHWELLLLHECATK